MKTMTIRNIPDEVAVVLKSMADQSDASVNTTIVRLLSDKVLPSRKKRAVNDFSKYCGGWSQKEYDKFEAAVADCERIDAEAWK